jgi:uncharacterized membrane protein
MRSPDLLTVAGLALAATGVAHFAKPDAFESITKTAFPDDTRTHTFINGGIETALGVALASRSTRRVGLVGLLGYGAYLGAAVARKAA